MAFRSEAQRRRFKLLVERGEIPQSVYDEWERATTHLLPERVKKAPEPRPKVRRAKLAKVIK